MTERQRTKRDRNHFAAEPRRPAVRLLSASVLLVGLVLFGAGLGSLVWAVIASPILQDLLIEVILIVIGLAVLITWRLVFWKPFARKLQQLS